MKIVIDVPKEMLEWVNDVNKFGNDYGIGEFIDLVKNGTPLPKGHGDLKDYDAIKSDYIHKMSVFMSEKERMDLLCTIVDEAPIIIDADRGDKNG